MQFTKLAFTSSLVAAVAMANEDTTTTSTVVITKTSTLAHSHGSATTDSFTTTETSVSSAATSSVVASSVVASSYKFDFSNATSGHSYNASSFSNNTGSISNVSTPAAYSSSNNGTYLVRREALPSEIAPVITYSAFGNKVGTATGVSAAALALVAGLLL
ncbi:hypothetical protein DASC09_061570 [Saccharomycopsis crataegensis]|uniref:Uncharacterized protein n=1 Tax=Saccharomycopsis crataegensis TaxID=43959 RepID=A0AAV5QXI8_9ASCO|nr:hypothetical protein DASC09_061570 [Saccharomycopsis crataegensis]